MGKISGGIVQIDCVDAGMNGSPHGWIEPQMLWYQSMYNVMR